MMARNTRLYAIQFPDGVVKIGRSENVDMRLNTLLMHSKAKRGGGFLDCEVFDGIGHKDSDAEARVVQRCASVFPRLPRAREWFLPADFDLVCMICAEETALAKAPRVRPFTHTCRCSSCRAGYWTSCSYTRWRLLKAH